MTTTIRPELTTDDLLRTLSAARAGYDDDTRREFGSVLIGALIARLGYAGRSEAVLSAIDTAAHVIERQTDGVA